jgi:hypothetical protein
MPTGIYKHKPQQGFQKRHPRFSEGCFKKGNIAWSKGKKLPHLSGNKANAWKGGKSITTQGYIIVYCPEDPRQYVLEHRLVMEKHLGRYLKPEEVVHHINGTKTDNRLNNLLLFANKGKHQKHHRKET